MKKLSGQLAKWYGRQGDVADWNLTYFAKLKILDDKKILFTSKLSLNVAKELVKRYVWSIALYGAGTW